MINDTCMVRTDELADALEKWVNKYERDHPQNTEGFSNRVRQIGALTFLAMEISRCSGNQVNSNYNKVARVRNRRAPFTSLTTADQILTAMGEFWRLHTDIEVIEKYALSR